MDTDNQYKKETLRKFGEQLRSVRDEKSTKRKKCTQTEMARILDVSNAYLSRLENGRSMPSIFFFVRLRALTNADLNALLAPAVERYLMEYGDSERRCIHEYTH